MSLTVRAPTGLPTSSPLAPGGTIVMGATCTDAPGPLYVATARDTILQVATCTDALGPIYTATASDRPGY